LGNGLDQIAHFNDGIDFSAFGLVDMSRAEEREEGGRRKEEGGRRKEEGGRRKEEGGFTGAAFFCAAIFFVSSHLDK
jgi:hypothetical protein